MRNILIAALLLAVSPVFAADRGSKAVVTPAAASAARQTPSATVQTSAATAGAAVVQGAANVQAVPAAAVAPTAAASENRAAPQPQPEPISARDLDAKFDGAGWHGCAHCAHDLEGDDLDDAASLAAHAALKPELKPYLPSRQDPQTWTQEVSMHLHSHFSDGTMAPEKVVELAYSKGVRVLALSDHDTIAGIMRAWTKAKELGMEFHPAIEMTARGGVHIGAVDVDITNPKLIAVIERMRAKRLHHMEAIVAKLNEHEILKEKGVTITIEEVRAKSKHDEGGTIELPHVARVLVDKGVISEVDRAFDELLKGDVLDNPGGQPDPTVDEVLEAINAAGGKAILNHPHTVRGADSRAKDKAVKAILAKGIHAIEVYRPLLPPRNDEDRRRNDQRAGKLLTWMDEFGLLAAPGADFHGTDTHLKHLSVWMPKALAKALLDELKAVNAAAVAALERLERAIARPSRPSA